MTKNKIAFLMPLYPPHFGYAKNFLKSFYKYGFDKQADMWFVFSNKNDRDLFEYAENSIIMPDNLKDLTRDQGVINAKKFYGLSQIKDKYEYIIVVDAEQEFSKRVNLHKLCEQWYNNKTLWGVPSINDYYFLIDKACRVFFKNKKIDSQWLVFWFINMCIYKTSMLDNFFDKTKILEHLDSLSFWTFDYYVFMYYLLAYENFTPKSICAGNPVETKGPLFDIDYIRNHMYMCTKQALAQLRGLVSGGGQNCFLSIHLDRGEYKQKSKWYKLRHFYWLKGKK